MAKQVDAPDLKSVPQGSRFESGYSDHFAGVGNMVAHGFGPLGERSRIGALPGGNDGTGVIIGDFGTFLSR